MKQLTFAILYCLFCWSATAQDIILLRNADEIAALVQEITDTEIKYKKFTNPAGVSYSIRRSEVFSITYSNGTKDLFTQEPAHQKPSAYPYPPVTKCYKLGDKFDEGGVRGIVIRITDEGRHGLILSFEQGEGHWCMVESAVSKNNRFDTQCTDPDDGWKNQKRVEAIIAHTALLWSNFAAFSWCKDLGPGWYLPAQRELQCVWNFGPKNPAFSFKDHTTAIVNLNQLLIEYGQEQMRKAQSYWSSTELTQQAAWSLVHTNAPMKPYYKGWVKYASGRVRAVHKF